MQPKDMQPYKLYEVRTIQGDGEYEYFVEGTVETIDDLSDLIGDIAVTYGIESMDMFLSKFMVVEMDVRQINDDKLKSLKIEAFEEQPLMDAPGRGMA